MSAKIYDLKERSSKFGENIILFCRSIKKDEVTRPLITQLVKCGTSIGANYCEADNWESVADFKHKIAICKKEASETKYFIKMMVVAQPDCKEIARSLYKEADELHLIFNAIFKKTSLR